MAEDSISSLINYKEMEYDIQTRRVYGDERKGQNQYQLCRTFYLIFSSDCILK